MDIDISRIEKMMAERLENDSFADTRNKLNLLQEQALDFWKDKEQLEHDAFDRLSQGAAAAGAAGMRIAITDTLYSFWGMTYEELAEESPNVQFHMAADREDYFYLNFLEFGPMLKKTRAWNGLAVLMRYRGQEAESFLYGKWEKCPPNVSQAELKKLASYVPQILAGGMTLEQHRKAVAEDLDLFRNEISEKRNDLEKMLSELAMVASREKDLSGCTFGIHPEAGVYFHCPFFLLPDKKSLCTLLEVRTPDGRDGFGAAMESRKHVIDEENFAALRNIFIFQKKGEDFRILENTAGTPLSAKMDFSWV